MQKRWLDRDLLLNGMKFLGLDYGVKRIGVATSDDSGKIAFPNKTILNDAHAFKRISESIKKENIAEIVVGESTSFSGEPNALQARIEIFIQELEKRFQLPVHKQKEFLTTVEARKQPKKNKSAKTSAADASAAALILQRYLDKFQNGKT